MEAFQNLAKQAGFKNKIVKQEFDLKCNDCGRYDYYEFDNGQVVKDGCDCDMIALAKNQQRTITRNNDVLKLKRFLNNLSLINH